MNLNAISQTPTQDPLRNDYLKLAQEAEAQKEHIERARNLPESLMTAVKNAGLIKRWATKAVGGEEASVSTVTQMIQEIAFYNGSLAWVIGVTGCSALFSGFIPPKAASELYKTPDSMLGGFAGPAGMARVVDGGLSVSGNWSWGSGIRHCSHIIGGVKLMEGEKFKATAVAMFQPEELDFIDNWHVLGLKGTNSIDYQAKEVFIPDGRWFPFPIEKAYVDVPLYRVSFLGALSTAVAAVGLGLAQRALSEIKALATFKRPFGQGKPLSKRPEIQRQLGMLEGQYLAAHAVFRETIRRAEQEVVHGPGSMTMRAQLRLASAQATAMAHQAVQGAFDLAGGSSIWQSNKLEELIRDMNVVKQHGMVNGLNFRTVGAFSLGEDVPPAML